jgi:hypothetical protein
VPLIASAMSAMFGLLMRLEIDVYQGVCVVIAPEDNVTASTAVTAIGSAFWNEFLATEACGTITAVAGAGEKRDRIYEFSGFHLWKGILGGCLCNDRYPPAFLVKLDDAFTTGEECMIFALHYVFAGMEFGSELSHDDGTSVDSLAVKTFHAQSFPATVAAIPC